MIQIVGPMPEEQDDGNSMTANKYSMSRFSLKFIDPETEMLYMEHIFHRTIWYCRIAWWLVIVLGGLFALLDRQVFGERAELVLLVRFSLISLAALVLAFSFSPRAKRFFECNSCFFVLSVGTFCTFLTVMSGSAAYSPYFTGLLFAFAGIFSTAGLGFNHSSIALLVNLVVFEFAVGYIAPVPLLLLVIYNFFLLSMLVIVGFIAWFIEVISRKNFIVSEQLSESLSQVKKLSGLLPICASCKKVRDDKGYWEQIESYISTHSEVAFSHGMCPVCIDEMYGEDEWYRQRKKQ